MNWLAIDTSTERASVALATGSELLVEEQHNIRQHAQFLLPMIDKLLATAQLNIQQLQGIIFGRGPGSFTGLRVACSIAKGLAYAHDLPLYPVSSLLAVAHAAYQQHTSLSEDVRVLAMLDARMHQVYWGCFTQTLEQVDEHVSSPGDIRVMGDRSLLLAGAGFDVYQHELPAALQALIMHQHVVFPHARHMIELVKAGRIQAVNAQDALPVYVRNQVVQGASGG